MDGDFLIIAARTRCSCGHAVLLYRDEASRCDAESSPPHDDFHLRLVPLAAVAAVGGWDPPLAADLITAWKTSGVGLILPYCH